MLSRNSGVEYGTPFVISPISRLDSFSPLPQTHGTPEVNSEDINITETHEYTSLLNELFHKQKHVLEEKALNKARLLQKHWVQDRKSFTAVIEEV